MLVKKYEGEFLGILLNNFGASMLGNKLTRKGVMRAGKGVVRAATGYNAMDHLDINFEFSSVL